MSHQLQDYIGGTTLLAVASLCLVAGADDSPRAQDGPAHVALKAARDSDFGHLDAALSVTLKNAAVEAGDALEAEVLFTCTNGFGEVFNPFLDRTLPLPMRVVVFSTEGEFLGDLLVADRRLRKAESYDRILLRVGDGVGTSLEIPTSARQTDVLPAVPKDANSVSRQPIRSLGPGKYLVQAIYRATLESPSRTARVRSEYWNGETLGRSKAVEIQVNPSR